jgi:hypothetical protein
MSRSDVHPIHCLSEERRPELPYTTLDTGPRYWRTGHSQDEVKTRNMTEDDMERGSDDLMTRLRRRKKRTTYFWSAIVQLNSAGREDVQGMAQSEK